MKNVILTTKNKAEKQKFKQYFLIIINQLKAENIEPNHIFHCLFKLTNEKVRTSTCQ